MAEVVSRRSIVYDILFDVSKGKKSIKQGQKELDKLDKSVKKVDKSVGSALTSFKGFAAAIAATAAARQLFTLGQEAVSLALKAEGVRKAFDKLNNENLLADLRKATRGTISDLSLMQASVRAANFKIPLQELAKFFKFASIRARETGESVDFLVNSIVDGIGRKSTLVLDNLGLSAAQIQEEFKKTGDLAVAVGNIIEKDMGQAVKTAADDIDTYRAAVENLKEEIGQKLIPVLGKAAKALTGLINFGAETEAKQEKALAFIDEYKNSLIGAFGIEITNMITELTDAELENLIAAQALADEFDILLGEVISLEKNGLKLSVTLKKQFTALQNQKTANKEAAEAAQNFTDRLKGFNEEIPPVVEGLGTLKDALDKFTAGGEGEEDDLFLEGATESLIGFLPVAERVGIVVDTLDQKLEKNRETIIENAEAVERWGNSLGSSIGALAGLAEQGSAIQLAFAEVSILADNAAAIANAIKAATAQAALLGQPLAIGPLIATVLPIVIGAFAQSFALLNRAKAAQGNAQGQASSATAFAEGEVDIQRPGQKRGKDSIPAMLMPGESVMTTTETAQHKPLLEAMREGTLEDLIHKNYVQPALAMSGGDTIEEALDYSDKFYGLNRTGQDGNMLHKRELRLLASIDRKLTTIPSRYV